MLVTTAEASAARPPRWVVPAVSAVYALLALPLVLRASAATSLMYAVPLLFWALAPTGYYYAFLVLLVLQPWRDGPPDRLRLLEMTLLTLTMAALYALEVVSADLIPLYYRASLALAGFFVLWLGLEHARAALAVTPPASSR